MGIGKTFEKEFKEDIETALDNLHFLYVYLPYKHYFYVNVYDSCYSVFPFAHLLNIPYL